MKSIKNLYEANNKDAKTYNLVAFGKVLNKKPLTIEKAEADKANCIMNYGYTPEIVEL